MSRKRPRASQLSMSLVDETEVDPGIALARQAGFSFICGVDEAGRGPLAGPLVAGAVIIHIDDALPSVADSKVLSAQQRQGLLAPIRSAVRGCAVAEAQVEEIDGRGILVATLAAMRRAIEEAWALAGRPEMLVVVDGSETIAGLPFRQRAVVDGDRGCKAISAASILAKERHDAILLELHAVHPQYGFDRHKGYGTAEHLEALKLHGPCAVHRRSFEPVRTLVNGGHLDGAQLAMELVAE